MSPTLLDTYASTLQLPSGFKVDNNTSHHIKFDTN